MSLIANPCIEIQTSEAPRSAVPPWFGEVTIIVQYLVTKGLLYAFAQKVRLIRGHFGRYEPTDFLALLFGYAISGERTLEAFCARVAPFASAFMALFGRRCCPHRASLSRFLADVDRPCLEGFRALFQQSFTDGWTGDSIGGIFDRQGHHSIVFDVDATRQAARQRALPMAPELPSPRRRLDAVCAAFLHGTQTRRGCSDAHDSVANAHAPMGRDVLRQGQWGLPGRTSKRSSGGYDLPGTVHSPS